MPRDQRSDRQEPALRSLPDAGREHQDGSGEGTWLVEGSAPRLYNAREAAHLMGIHINTLKRIPPDKLPYFGFGSRGDRRYRHVDVMEYIERRMKR